MEGERVYSSEGVSWKRWPDRCVRAAAIAAVTVMLLLSVLTMPPIGAAHLSAGESADTAAVDWELAPSWPFRGVVAHYGEEYQYMLGFEYRITDELGLQFLDTERNQVSYLLLDRDLDSGELGCASVQSSYDAAGITWVWRDGYISRGRLSWYVPWGDFAYPLFTDDVADVVGSEAESEYDPDYSEYDPDNSLYISSLGTDGRTLEGWLKVHSEPACGGDIVFATQATTGDLVACGWSRANALFVDPAVTYFTTTYERASDFPDVQLYEDCNLLDLRQWQQALAGRDDA